MASVEIAQYWVMYVTGGGPYSLQQRANPHFYPGNGISLSEVSELDEIPKALGTIGTGRQVPMTGTDISPPTEYDSIKITGTSPQNCQDYEALQMNSAPDVQFKPYSAVVLQQWTSVVGAGSLVKTIEFVMSGPIIILVNKCKTQIATSVEFSAEIAWEGGAQLTRTDVMGNALRPFGNVRCAKTELLTMYYDQGLSVLGTLESEIGNIVSIL